MGLIKYFSINNSVVWSISVNLCTACGQWCFSAYLCTCTYKCRCIKVLWFSGNLKLIKVKLDSDMLGLVRRLLSESDLPLDEIDEIIELHNSEMESSSSGQPDRPILWIHRHYFAATGKEYPFTDIWEELDKMKPAVTLQ